MVHASTLLLKSLESKNAIERIEIMYLKLNCDIIYTTGERVVGSVVEKWLRTTCIRVERMVFEAFSSPEQILSK